MTRINTLAAVAANHTIRHFTLTLAAASVLATGCLAAESEIGVGGADLAHPEGAKEVVGASDDSGSDAFGHVIQAPVFYESDEHGEVIGGPVPDFVPDEAFKNAGSRPIHIQKYGPFGNGGTLSTGFPTSAWIATVVGIDTTDGDINEVGTGNPLRAFPFQSNGIWNVTFDLRSHGNNESWSIWIMYVNRSMATATNF